MDPFVPYAVSYSGRVRDELVALVARAREVGLADRVLAAIRDIDYRLRIYPQFGQPLRTLAVDSAELWIGVVDPLVVQYVMDESHRQVMVVRPPTPIAGCGL